MALYGRERRRGRGRSTSPRDSRCPLPVAVFKHAFELALFFHIRSLSVFPQRSGNMQEHARYEVVEGGGGWVLRQGRTPLVEFPTEGQAVRAAVAVCRDEGLGRLLIRRACGGVEELDPGVHSLETREA